MAALFIPACWLMNFLCFGFSVELFPMQRLEAARSTWEANHIRDYEMVVLVSQAHVSGEYLKIVVRNGEVIEAGRAWILTFTGTFETIRDFTQYEVGRTMQSLPSRVTDYTIDRLFEVAASEIVYIPDIQLTRCGEGRYRVDFDSQLGYIRYFAADIFNPYEYGLNEFCPKFHANGERFMITKFEVLPD
jgi:hypothetical protein